MKKSSRKTKSRRSHKLKQVMCPYKQIAEKVHKMNKDQLIVQLLKELEISSRGKNGQIKKAQLARGSKDELSQYLIRIMNSKYDRNLMLPRMSNKSNTPMMEPTMMKIVVIKSQSGGCGCGVPMVPTMF